MKTITTALIGLLALSACTGNTTEAEITTTTATTTTLPPTTTTTTITEAPITTEAGSGVPACDTAGTEWQLLQSPDGRDPWTTIDSGTIIATDPAYPVETTKELDYDLTTQPPDQWYQFRNHWMCNGVVDTEWYYSKVTPPSVVTTVASTTTQAPIVTEAPGPDLAGAQEFVDIFVADLQPDLIGVCPLVRDQPEMVQGVLRESFNDPAVREQAAEYRIDPDEFVDMFVITYGNRLAIECGS